MARSLFTDLYELNMVSSYLRRGMAGVATFSLFVRQVPARRGFLVALGSDHCLDWLEKLRFSPDELDYLSGIGFDSSAIEAFAELRFTGEVWAVPEGRVVFANEPLLEVSAPIAEAQLAETFLLNQVTFQTALASKAARCRIAAGDRMDLVEFGFRRTHGIDAALAAARAAAIVGFSATSNVEACRRYGLSPAGTMAHSYIQAFPTEEEAFRAFASDVTSSPDTFLVDTYDTIVGVGKAIEVIKDLGLETRSGIRLDSGDIEKLARRARDMLDQANLREVRIFVSGGLDENDIAKLVAARAPVDAVGVGTLLGVSADAPYLDSVYKLVEYDGQPSMKLSEGKATLPGAKQVFRSSGMKDVLGLRHEHAPAGSEPLLERVMSGGRRLLPPAGVDSARLRFETDLAQLPEALKRMDPPSPPGPELSDALAALAEEVSSTVSERGRRGSEGGANPSPHRR